MNSARLVGGEPRIELLQRPRVGDTRHRQLIGHGTRLPQDAYSYNEVDSHLLQMNQPLSWYLYHPDEGLWNWDLVRALSRVLPISVHRRVVRAIVFVDTLILWARALVRRASRTGIMSLRDTARAPKGVSILYFDLGTHREAREMAFMVDNVLPRLTDRFAAYGFEAGRTFFEEARARFADRDDVTVIQGALCHAPPAGGKLKLYKGRGEGRGSSLYRHTYGDYEEVDAMRFSDWLRARALDLDGSICLVRMNIEGAEYDVMLDLVEAGLAWRIDGYFGMWDDVSKIDKGRYDEFRSLLRRNGITHFTFNGRDLAFPFRMRCIEYDIGTAVLAGMRRIGARAAG